MEKILDLDIFTKKVSKWALVCFLVGWLVGNAVFSEMAQRIFLIFCVKLGDYKSRKVTARFLKKILDLEIFPKRSPNYCRLVGWLVGNAVFSETARRIFLIFCMKLGDYKGRKVTEPDFWKKFLIWRYSRKSLQISPKSDTLIFFSKTALFFWFLAWS